MMNMLNQIKWMIIETLIRHGVLAVVPVRTQDRRSAGFRSNRR